MSPRLMSRGSATQLGSVARCSKDARSGDVGKDLAGTRAVSPSVCARARVPSPRWPPLASCSAHSSKARTRRRKMASSCGMMRTASSTSALPSRPKPLNLLLLLGESLPVSRWSTMLGASPPTPTPRRCRRLMRGAACRRGHLRRRRHGCPATPRRGGRHLAPAASRPHGGLA